MGIEEEKQSPCSPLLFGISLMIISDSLALTLVHTSGSSLPLAKLPPSSAVGQWLPATSLKGFAVCPPVVAPYLLPEVAWRPFLWDTAPFVLLFDLVFQPLVVIFFDNHPPLFVAILLDYVGTSGADSWTRFQWTFTSSPVSVERSFCQPLFWKYPWRRWFRVRSTMTGMLPFI